MNAQTKEALPSWLTIARSIALIVTGILLLVYETAIDDEPNHLIVGTGLVLLGLAPGVQIVQRLTNGAPK